MTNATKTLNLRLVYTTLFLVALIVVNIILVWPFFMPGYTQHLASDEAVFISLAKFIHDHFPEINWNQMWYMGFPFYLFGTPFLPFLLAFIHSFLSNIPLASIYRMTVAIFYVLGPVSFYLFVRYLTKRELTAVIAALAYTVPFLSPSLFKETRELQASFGYVPWRLLIATVFGKGSYIIALAILPLVALAYLHMLRKREIKFLVLASFGQAFCALVDWLAFFVLSVILVILLVSEMLLAERGQKLKWGFWSYVSALGLASFWYNIPFIKALISYIKGFEIALNYAHLLPLAFLILPSLLTFLFLSFDHKKALQPLFITIVWFLMFFTFIGSWYFWQKPLFPNSFFLIPVLDMAFALALGLFCTFLTRFVFRKLGQYFVRQLSLGLTLGLALTLVAIFVYVSFLFLGPSYKITAPHPDIKTSPEYKTILWLKEHNQGRVFAGGKLKKWLNVFSDIKQVAGGENQGAIHPWWQKASLEIEAGEDGELACLWAKALGIKYLVMDEKSTSLGKFDGLQERVKTLDKYVVFEVPENFKLVKAVNKDNFENLPNLEDVQDKKALEVYVDYLKSGTKDSILGYSFDKNRIEIETNIKENEALALLVSFDAHWQAQANNKKIPIKRDPLGFMYLVPEKTGRNEISLSYQTSGGWWLGLITTIFFVNLFLALGVKPIRQRLQTLLKHYRLTYVPYPGVREEFVKALIGEEKPPQELEAKTKRYYRDIEDEDIVKATDQFKGLLTLFHRRRERVMRKLIEDYGQGAKYLDAGCGPGLILRHLPPGSVGVDINPRYVERAKLYAPQAIIVQADIDHLPFPDNSFTTVICTEVLEHLADPISALKEIKRVLIPGGVVIGSVPNRSVFWRLRSALGARPPDEPFHKEYTKDELMVLLSEFKKVKISYALSEMLLIFIVRKRE